MMMNSSIPTPTPTPTVKVVPIPFPAPQSIPTTYLHFRHKVVLNGRFIEIAAKGGATVAYRTGIANFGDGDVVVIKGAVAVCLPEDNFSLKQGRENALKLLDGPTLKYGFTNFSKMFGDVNRRRVFIAEVGRADDLETRVNVADGSLEVLHDNKRIRKLIQRHVQQVLGCDYWQESAVYTNVQLILS